jgi:hypothetical protein
MRCASVAMRVERFRRSFSGHAIVVWDTTSVVTMLDAKFVDFSMRIARG